MILLMKQALVLAFLFPYANQVSNSTTQFWEKFPHTILVYLR